MTAAGLTGGVIDQQYEPYARPLYPFWGIIGIAVSFFVLYALIVHGGELNA